MVIRKPTSRIGKVNQVASKWKPKMVNSQAVIVVPILAPMMTPMDWTSVNMPALTNPTAMMVVALEDCNSDV